MSYRIYTTEAVILKKADSGEADRVYSMFSEDFGRVSIRAVGSRHLKSKLRYNLSGLSLLRVSFIPTRFEYFKIVYAREIFIFDNIRKDSRKMKSAFMTLDLVARLVRGTEKDPELWAVMKDLFFLLDREFMSDESVKYFEIFAFLKILASLGYAGVETPGVFSPEYIGGNKAFLISKIKGALAETML